MFPCRQTRAQAHGGSELLAKTCHVAVLAGLIAFAACFPGCDRSDPFFSSDGPSQLSLRQTFDYLRQCRLAGDYSALRPHIDPGGRDGVVDLLVAVDELMLANTAALEAMKRSCPDVEVQPYDLSFFQNKLELLSRDVEWIEAASKDRAEVVAQVGSRLPLVRCSSSSTGSLAIHARHRPPADRQGRPRPPARSTRSSPPSPDALDPPRSPRVPIRMGYACAGFSALAESRRFAADVQPVR